MPLRKWMSEHGHPSWWSWLVVIGACFSSMVISIVVSAVMNQRGIERERMARFQSEQQWCSVIVVMDDAWRSKPPATATGKEMAKGIRELRVGHRCPPAPPEQEK